jgi:YD repeat-containing protein
VTDRNGRLRTYTYDEAGRLATETWYAPDGVTVEEASRYTYDAQGRLASASERLYGKRFFHNLARFNGVTVPSARIRALLCASRIPRI